MYVPQRDFVMLREEADSQEEYVKMKPRCKGAGVTTSWLVTRFKDTVKMKDSENTKHLSLQIFEPQNPIDYIFVQFIVMVLLPFLLQHLRS